MVHIDVDLYEPARAAVDFFHPRLHTGTMVVCEDHQSEASPGAKRAMDEAAAALGTHVVHLTTSQGLIMKPQAG